MSFSAEFMIFLTNHEFITVQKTLQKRDPVKDHPRFLTSAAQGHPKKKHRHPFTCCISHYTS